MSAVQTSPKKAHRRRWGTSIEKSAIEWSHELFGQIQISCRGFKVGNVRQEGINSWCRIFRNDREPDRIRLDFYTDLEDGVFLFQSKKGSFKDMTEQDLLPFDVNVKWNEIEVKGEGGRVIELTFKPETRKTDEDNFDLFFLRQNGEFVQLQICLVSRGGEFYCGIQEIYGGCVVTASSEEIEKRRRQHVEVGGNYYTILPVYPENCYAGADMLSGASRREALGLIDEAVKRGAVAPFDNVDIGTWECYPPELPVEMKGNWEPGVVKFFNLVLGWGFITVIRDGKPLDVFTHFSSIMDEKGKKPDFPVLQPMTAVAVKVGKDDKTGKPKAMGVQVL